MTRSAKIAQRVLIVACIASVLAGFFIEHRPHFAFEAWPGFFALFGFVAYCGIVLSAKQLRPLLGRDENYYGDEDPPETEVTKQEHSHG